MFKLLGNIPRKVAIGVSGGLDSMVALHFLLEGRRDVTVVNVNHGTEYSKEAIEFVRDKCKEIDVPFYTNAESPSKIFNNREQQWRDIRYEVFDIFTLKYDMPLITMHHLDDVVETWLHSTLNGKPKTIPYKRERVIRPFLMVKREQIDEYADRHDIDYIDDPSNLDCNLMRNHIRHNLVPEALVVNPGLHKMVAKLVENRYNKLHG